MKQGVRESTIALLTVLLICFQPAYANGSHVHLGGIFFLAPLVSSAYIDSQE